MKLGDQFVAHNQRWSGGRCKRNIWAGALTGIDEGDNHYTLDYFQRNTTIDLYHRPQKTAAEMIAAGWDVPDDDSVFSTYSSGYSNEAGTKAVLVTPILQNGNVLSPAQLESYANQLLRDESIDVDILLNTFTGTGTALFEELNKYAEEFHTAQPAS